MTSGAASTQYDVVFDDPVRGLTEGGEVRFNGIKVGEVESLRIDPDNTNRVIARIRVSVRRAGEDRYRGQLEPIGLTGVTLIQLSPAALRPNCCGPAFGAPPPRIQGRGQPDRRHRGARSEEVALRASEAMAAVRDLLTDENIARVTRTLNETWNRVAATRIARFCRHTQSGEAAAKSQQLARQMQTDLADLDRGAGRSEPGRRASPPARRCRSWRLPPKKSAALPLGISRVANNLEETHPSLRRAVRGRPWSLSHDPRR